MATVHPSRMGLVPQEPKAVYPDLRRGNSSPPPRGYDRDRRDRKRDKEGEGVRDREGDSDSERGWSRRRGKEQSEDRRDRRRDRNDERASPRRRAGGRRADDRDEDRGRHRERLRDRPRTSSRRRGSPEYGDYKRLASPGPAAPSMYPNRQPRDGEYERQGTYGGGGSDYLEGRRAQREGSTFSIWPPSPKAAARSLSPQHGSSRRKSKRDRSETPTESSDLEPEHRRRERKDRKRARKGEQRKEKKERQRRSQSYDSDREEHSEDRNSDRKSKSKTRPRSPSRSPTPSSSHMLEGEDEWVEKDAVVAPFMLMPQNGSMPPPATVLSHSEGQLFEDSADDSDGNIGPQPLAKMNASKKVDERAYGGALLRGEGSAMAAFLKDDTQTRIPRRGEIGLTSDEIAQFEAVGYVMSGSRHKRMNAVRIRKENQVISAEEKRSILKLQKEERERRETILREEFSELVHERLKGPEAKRTVT